MPEKTTAAGRRYEVDGRRFTWFPLDDDDNEGEPLTLPLRIKLGAVRGMMGENLDASAMLAILGKIAPEDVVERMDEMDLSDFEAMFATWNKEYSALSGASLGESASSSS